MSELDQVTRAVLVLQRRGPESGAPFGEPEARALAALYGCYAAVVAAVAAPLLPCRSDVEEVVHDVFVALPRALQRYRTGNFAGWLRRVTVRAALMRLRTAGRRRESDLTDRVAAGLAATGGRTVEEDFVALEDAAAVRRALAALPEGLRVVVVLRVCHGYSHARIARALGITPSASEQRFARGRARLRDVLRELRD